MRLCHDLVAVTGVRTMNNLEVVLKEFVIKVASGPEIKEIQHTFGLVIQVIGWVWVCLHHLPLKQLPETKLKHQ